MAEATMGQLLSKDTAIELFGEEKLIETTQKVLESFDGLETYELKEIYERYKQVLSSQEEFVILGITLAGYNLDLNMHKAQEVIDEIMKIEDPNEMA